MKKDKQKKKYTFPCPSREDSKGEQRYSATHS